MAIDIEAPGAHESDLEAALFALAPFRGARVRRTSDLTTANLTTTTAVTWQEAAVDTDTFWSAGAPTRLTVPAAYNGKHANVQFNARINLVTADTYVLVRLIHRDSGGAAKFVSQLMVESGNTSQYGSVTLIGVPIATGDYFEGDLTEESDTSVTVASGASSGMAIQIIG